MRAVTRHGYGEPDVLGVREIETPAPAADEILVKVRATTVNRTDCGILRGTPFVIRFFTGLRRPSSPVPGTDFAGEVVQTGSAVTSYAVGERVMGFDDSSCASQAEYVAISADAGVVPIPDGVSDVDAVASIEGGHYAVAFLSRSGYQPGQRVCVYGATGAIGSAAVQLARAQGSHVTAFCRAEHHDLVRGLGAEEVLDYRTEPLTAAGDGFDRFFDAVGKRTFAEARPLLRPDGHYVSSELGPRGQNVVLPAVTRLRRGPRVDFPVPGRARDSLTRIAGVLADGSFRPLVDRHYAMADVRAAYEYVLTGQKVGNVVLEIG
jgi:NADPH:quinone reductase-like Zn-dependent oxidoreductase